MMIGILQAKQLELERAERLREAIIVDARTHDQYRQGHIPGAVWVGWDSWCARAPRRAGPVLAQDGYWGVLNRVSAREYGRRLASYGLSDERPIVVYGDGPYTRGSEGRIAWMLLYLGASTVYLLDGGWRTWFAQGGKIQADADNVTSGHFTVRFQPQRRQTFRTLRTSYRTGTVPVLIDTRSRAEYSGEQQDHLPRGGHLVGAHLLPFTDLFQSDGCYLGKETYLTMLPREARQATSLVAYCDVGVRASLFAMLHETYTGQVVAVYDGSMTQWALAPNLPMANALTGVARVNERRLT